MTPEVVCASPDDPAIKSGGIPRIGSDRDLAHLTEVFGQGGIVTFENEFVDVAILDAAQKSASVTFRPSLDTIAVLQNKLKQKSLMEKTGVIHGRFTEVIGPRFEDELIRVGNQFPGGFVLKWARLGYDGKGIWIGPSKGRLSDVELERAVAFLKAAQTKGVEVFAEEKVAFSCEVAMIGARGLRGDIVTYPLVVSEQEHGICKWVTGQAAGLGIESRLENDAKTSLIKVMKELDYVGILACEFFVTIDERLLVNELAPRVHNSGHYSQDAASVSQFLAHVKAVCGQQLDAVETDPYFVMGNLIGPPGVTKPGTLFPQFSPLPKGFVLHWYGKNEIRPGRKVGHINAAAKTREEFDQVVREMRSYVTSWEAGLKS